MKKKKKGKSVKKVVARIVGNKYDVKMQGKSMMFSVLKTLKNGKRRTDGIKLSPTDIRELKKTARVSKDAYFELCDKLIVTPCKLDSAAKKAGLTKNTGYDPSHYTTAKVLGIKVKA